MIVLGIETSCDETAAAVVENGTKILSNVVASSADMHSKTGGIIPEAAAREQVKSMIPVLEEALEMELGCVVGSESGKKGENENEESFFNPNPQPKPRLTTRLDSVEPRRTHNSSLPSIDAIAVTVGPGLIGSLLVGVETAKTLAYVWNKPIIPVNHLGAHIYANWLTPPPSLNPDSQPVSTRSSRGGLTTHPQPQLPAIALVVSGGHTDLVLMKNHGEIEWLGGTRDDAAGECFDKSARLLELGYPGGPAIAVEASKWQMKTGKWKIALPRPMINEDNFDFSFSGLKTAVLREVNNLKNNQQFNNLTVQQLCYEIQEAITDVLVSKTIRAAETYKVKSILLAGGVSANQRLREKFHYSLLPTTYTLHIPPPKLCTDNAAYIASCAYFNYKPVSWQNINPLPGLSITSKL